MLPDHGDDMVELVDPSSLNSFVRTKASSSNEENKGLVVFFCTFVP